MRIDKKLSNNAIVFIKLLWYHTFFGARQESCPSTDRQKKADHGHDGSVSSCKQISFCSVATPILAIARSSWPLRLLEIENDCSIWCSRVIAQQEVQIDMAATRMVLLLLHHLRCIPHASLAVEQQKENITMCAL